MEDTGCKDLPLAAERKSILLGFVLPEIAILDFDRDKLCYEQLLTCTPQNTLPPVLGEGVYGPLIPAP